MVALPEQLMDEAERLRGRHPKKAHALAARSVQILILTLAPIRISNLMAIRFGVNLLRPGGPHGVYVIDFPLYDVKNRVDLQFPLAADVTALIDRYIRFCHRKPKHGEFLIENEEGEKRSPAHASKAIADLVEKRVGLRVTAHQFRHAAGAIILKHEPGNYEFVRRVLGHLNIQTTIRFYTALESFQATKIFGEMIAGQHKAGKDGKR